MNNTSFSEYSTKQVHFLDEAEEVPALLKFGLSLISRTNSTPRIVDLGCGDGKLIFALYKKGLLQNVGAVIGVDISEDRIKRLTKELSFVKGITSDALNVKYLPNSFADVVICSQVIEHVNDRLLLIEIKRLLTDGGIAYISSVIKKWYGAYFYFNNGSFRLDPTHVREYSSMDEFVNLILKEGFDVIVINRQNMLFPLPDMIVRFFIKFGLIEPNVNFYHQHKFISKVRKLKVPIIGYQICEVLVSRKR